MVVYLLVAAVGMLISPAHAQVTALKGTVRYSNQNNSKSLGTTLDSLTKALDEIIRDVISTRVDAQFSKGVTEEASRCISACDRYQQAASKMRREIVVNGMFTSSTHAEFKQAGERYLVAHRDFRSAVPTNPYKLPGWKIGGRKASGSQ